MKAQMTLALMTLLACMAPLSAEDRPGEASVLRVTDVSELVVEGLPEAIPRDRSLSFRVTYPKTDVLRAQLSSRLVSEQGETLLIDNLLYDRSTRGVTHRVFVKAMELPAPGVYTLSIEVDGVRAHDDASPRAFTMSRQFQVEIGQAAASSAGEPRERRLGIRVQFGSNEWRVEERFLDRIQAVALAFRKTDDGAALLIVEGHTDARGSPAYNRDLAEARAIEARLALIEAGLPGERIRVRGFGSERPAAARRGPKSDQANRRVEFVILLGGGS